jgi:hypothetical protein
MDLLDFLIGRPIRAERDPLGLSADEAELAQLSAYYRAHIEPLTRKFENQRLASLKTARGRIYTGLGIFACLGLFYLLLASVNAAVNPLPLLVVALPLAWWCYNPVRRYRGDVHRQIYPLLFRYFGEDFIYSRERHMSLSRLEASKLLPRYDDASFDDYVRGSYHGVDIAINELTLTLQVKQKKHRETQTCFQGLIVELGCHKAFEGHTLVAHNRGGLVNFFSDQSRGLSRVRLEDPRFEQRFDVFASDQIEARYLLTTAFMERLQTLADAFEGQLQCAFHGDALIIMLACSRDRFQPGSIFKGASFEYEFSQINSEMKQLFAIIDILKLHQHTGL